MCKAVANNIHYSDSFSLFESASVFFDNNFASAYDARELLPQQRKHVAAALVGASDQAKTLFRKAKGIVEALPGFLHLEPLFMEQKEAPIWADPVVWLNIISNEGIHIGILALLSKKAAVACGIKNNSVMLLELDIDALKPLPSRSNTIVPVAEYPQTEYDLSLLFDVAIRWQQIHDVVKGCRDPESLLKGFAFVDEYQGSQVPEGNKSITLRLIIGSNRKTLTSGEIESFCNNIVASLIRTLGAQLRS